MVALPRATTSFGQHGAAMRMLTLKTVLAATDLRDGSLATIEAARALADSAGAALHIVHVGTTAPTEAKAAYAQLADLGFRLDEAAVHTVGGEAVAGILGLACEIAADVIVVGPHRDERCDGSPHDLGTA